MWMELMCIKRRHENGCMWPSEGYSPAVVVVAEFYTRWVTWIPTTPIHTPDCSFICKLNGFCSCVSLITTNTCRRNIAGLARPNFRSWASLQNRILQQYGRTHSLLWSRQSISRGNSNFPSRFRRFMAWCNDFNAMQQWISHFFPLRVACIIKLKKKKKV